MRIDWTILTYFFVLLFVIQGSYRGWWREGVVTAFLSGLVFFLLQPTYAQTFIDLINSSFALVWDFLPGDVTLLIEDALTYAFGPVDVTSGPPELDAREGGMWLIMMLVFLIVGVVVGRYTLREYIQGAGDYVVFITSPAGRFLGAIIGGLNGLIIINLIREYFDGRNLPGGPPSEVALAGSSGIPLSSSGFEIAAVNAPSITILDSFIPFLIIGFGLVMVLAILGNRISYNYKDGFRKVTTKSPYGYREVNMQAK